MAIVSKRLYESPQEGSFVDFQFDNLTNLGTGIRIVSGTGAPLLVGIKLTGAMTTRVYAPGVDITWTFLSAPTVTPVPFDSGITTMSINHGPALTPGSAAAVVL